MVIAVFGFIPLCYAQTTGEQASIEDIKKETQDLLAALKSYTAAQREEAIQQTKSAIERLDKRIDALETSIDNNLENMNKAAREKARASLKSLRQKRVKVAEWYGSLKSSSVDAWEHIKNGLSDAYKAFFDAWEKAEKEFDSNQ
jgi:chromosome segregation ATPase